MSKRSSKSGDSPTPKNLRVRESFDFLSNSYPDSEELNCSPSFLDNLEDSQPPPLLLGSSPAEKHNFGFLQEENPPDPPESDAEVGTQNSTNTTGSAQTDFNLFLEDQRETFAFETHSDIEFSDLLEGNIAANGIKESVEAILANGDLKKEILKQLFNESHHSLKSTLKDSKLCANKNDRDYLLSLSPGALCEEFKTNSSSAFLCLVQGLLGISDPDEIFNS